MRIPGSFLRFPAIAAATGALFGLLLAQLGFAQDAGSEMKEGRVFTATDSLNCGEDADPDGAACLAGLKWPGGDFAVRCESARNFDGDWLMRFPTPFPTGDVPNDSVAMEWHMARDESGRPKKAPAVVVVHESGRGMVAGRIFARGFRSNGFHAFLLHLPGYGARTTEAAKDIRQMFPGLRQAIADVRRARDAVAALPLIDTSLIALQGTSLGGFVTATVAGLDQRYDKYFILLAGGHLKEVLLNGGGDAASMRKQLREAGITEQEIIAQANVIEPMRLAHRVDPARTWLFCGKYDEVVPPRCSHEFAKSARLPQEHHLEMPVGHYTAAFLLPVTLKQMLNLLQGRPIGENLPGGIKIPEPKPAATTPAQEKQPKTP